jgi:hypothetical protein
LGDGISGPAAFGKESRLAKTMNSSTRTIASLFVLIACLTTSLAFAQGNPPLVATKVRLLTPFLKGSVGIGFAISGQGQGTCFGPSVASSGRVDAWRCTVGNAIHDPCYQNVMGDSKTLVCADAPWQASGMLLTLASPLPEVNRKPVSVKDTQPWAIELSNGQRCTLFTGATAPIAGMRITYGCSGGYVAVGDINRTGPVWKIFAQGEKSISLDEIEISTAWY